MAEQTVASDVIDAVQEVTETAVATAAKVTQPAEAKPATRKSRAPKAKQPARKAAAASRRNVAAKTAKPAPAKAQPAKKPAAARKQTRPARAAATTIEGVKTMTRKNQGIDNGLFAAEQFTSVFGDVNERAKAAAERSAKIAEELADLTRGNVEAFVASSKIAAKGVEALSQDAAEYSRKSFEEASAALKSFAEVKSATDFFKLQGDYARAAFDSAVAESARLSETVLKLAGEAAEPITSRYTVAAERVKTLAA
ncbi:MAG TPA: phasin family protein [Allosphingosinicella sp.]|nr:phasin family protein [Allosphingosinicella sp.]